MQKANPRFKACINIKVLNGQSYYYLVKVVEERGNYFFKSLCDSSLTYFGRDEIARSFLRDRTYVVFGYVDNTFGIRKFNFTSSVIYLV